MCLSETQCELKFGLLIKELPHIGASNEWVYLVLECTPATAKTIEFKKLTPSGRL
jgi:hypothetical protein